MRPRTDFQVLQHEKHGSQRQLFVYLNTPAYPCKPLSVHRRPVIGYPEDIERLGRREVQAFFQRHYGPSNLTIAVRCTARSARARCLLGRKLYASVFAAGALPSRSQLCCARCPLAPPSIHPPNHPTSLPRWLATCGQQRSAAWLSATLAAGGRMRSPPACVRAAAPAGWKLWRPHPPLRQNGSIVPSRGQVQHSCMPTTGPASGIPTR